MEPTQRQGNMSFAEIEAIPTRLSYLEDLTHLNSVNHTATAGLDSGTPTAIGASDITDTTKTWEINAFADKVVMLIASTGDYYAGIVTSNTDNRLIFDDVILSDVASYEILDTVVLESGEAIVACDITSHCLGIILPEVSSIAERTKVITYIEQASNGDCKVPVVARGTNRVRGYKFLTLEHKYEALYFLSHTWGTYHWDLTSTENVKRYARLVFTADTPVVTTEYTIPMTNTNSDMPIHKRFEEKLVGTERWAKYMSRVDATFNFRGTFYINKTSTGDTVLEMALRIKKASDGTYEDILVQKASVEIPANGMDHLMLDATVKLIHGDEVTLIIKRDTGTVSILAGSGLLINEL